MANEQERQRGYYIPANLKGYINIGPLSLRFRNVIEGMILGAILTPTIFRLFLNLSFLETGTAIGFAVVISISITGLAIIGIDGDPLSVFLWNLFRFLTRRRVAFRNPRVKKEYISIVAEEERNKNGSDEKVQSLFDRYVKNKFVELNQQRRRQTVSHTKDLDGEYEFEDDAILEEKENDKKLKRGIRINARK